jgi:oligosaccharide repeat unit polymerase
MLGVSQQETYENRFTPANAGTFGFGWLWLTVFSCSIGLVTIWSREVSILAYFVPIAYLTMSVSLLQSIHTWHDPFNPLCLVLIFAFVRFCLPGILILNGTELPHEVRLFFHQMRLSDADWQWGHALALLGILIVVMGWLCIQEERGGKCRSELKFCLAPGVEHAAVGGMLLGGVALGLFFFSNASLDAITSGTFRGTEIQVGTGKYFYMTYLLIAGSVLLSCGYLIKNRTWCSLLPVGMSMMLYWILGGRARAIFSFAAGLVLLWYFSAERGGWQKCSIKAFHVLAAPLMLFSGIWLSFVGSLYRGGFGSRAVIEALSFAKLWDYVQRAIFIDFGQLHSLAGAVAIGPGLLNGHAFLAVLTWPLSEFMPFRGRSAGVFIAETLVGFSKDRRWGVNASLIGDAYLNFGLIAVLIVLILFGALLKMLYLKFRQGKVHAAIYAVALLSSFQIYFLSIEKWPQGLTILLFMFAIICLGRTLGRIR